jgi:hypothetical protein
MTEYTVNQTEGVTNLGGGADHVPKVPHTSSPDNNFRRRSDKSGGPSNWCVGRVGSRQSPWVWQRGQWGSDSPMGCVCSGWIFLGLGSLRTRGGLASLGPLECIRQWGAPGKAPLRQGVPLPVTPWQGDLRVARRVATSWRSWVTSARRASMGGEGAGFRGERSDLGGLTELCHRSKAPPHSPRGLYISCNMTCVFRGLSCNPTFCLKPAIAKI